MAAAGPVMIEHLFEATRYASVELPPIDAYVRTDLSSRPTRWQHIQIARRKADVGQP